MKNLNERLSEAHAHLEKRIPEILNDMQIDTSDVVVDDRRFAYQLRQVLCSNTLPLEVRSKLWDIIDAIAFYIEVKESTWKYQTHESKQQYLTWVMEL